MSHQPYRVQIGDEVLTFPAGTTRDQYDHAIRMARMLHLRRIQLAPSQRATRELRRPK